MTTYRLIDDYIALLRSQVGWHRDVDGVLAEVEDHLLSAVERQHAAGVDALLAQRTALDRFGDPALVARAFATTPEGGLAVPTRTTRTGGVFAIVSGILWLAVVSVWWFAGLTADPVGHVSSSAVVWSDVAYTIGAGALLGSMGLMVAAMMALERRHGGLGPLGGAGLIVTGAGFVASLAAWVFTGWGTLTTVGTVLFSIAMWRRDLAPRLPTLAFGGGLAAGAIVWAILRATRGVIDLNGLWGDPWLENMIGLTIGLAILALGLIGLGRWLRSEEPAYIDSTGRPLTA